MTNASLDSKRLGLVIARMAGFIQLDEWVKNGGLEDRAPDLTFIDEELNKTNISRHYESLVTWSKMFSDSIEAYHSWVSTDDYGWMNTTEHQVCRLEKMLERSSCGAKLWMKEYFTDLSKK